MQNSVLRDGSGIFKYHPKFGGPLEISGEIRKVTFRLDLLIQRREEEYKTHFSAAFEALCIRQI